MTHPQKWLKAALLSSAFGLALAGAVAAQTGSVLSDLDNPEVKAKHRAEAAERIKCDPIADWDAKIAAYEAGAAAKWDRAGMGCAVEAGADAMRDLSLPTNLIWAVVTFRTDNIERHLQVFGAHLEYFDVLAKSYSDHYEGIEKSSELAVRWEQNRARSEEMLVRITPLVPKLTEARILRAAYYLSSTAKETSPEEGNKAMALAIEDLEIALEENPEALDGLACLIMGQLLTALPEFLGGDALRGIELLERANELNPTDLAVHRALTEAYLGERDDDKAVALLEAALAVDPAAENAQDYVDDTKFLGGLAVRAGRDDLASQFGKKRDAMLAENTSLLERRQSASFGHGGADPITGKRVDDLN